MADQQLTDPRLARAWLVICDHAKNLGEGSGKCIIDVCGQGLLSVQAELDGSKSEKAVKDEANVDEL